MENQSTPPPNYNTEGAPYQPQQRDYQAPPVQQQGTPCGQGKNL